MTNKGSFPFNTAIGAAVRDARSIEETLQDAKTSAPGEWHAFKISQYWDGQVTIAVVGPDNFKSETLVHAYLDGKPQQIGQPVFGIAIPYLIAKDADEIELRFEDQAITLQLIPA